MSFIFVKMLWLFFIIEFKIPLVTPFVQETTLWPLLENLFFLIFQDLEKVTTSFIWCYSFLKFTVATIFSQQLKQSSFSTAPSPSLFHFSPILCLIFNCLKSSSQECQLWRHIIYCLQIFLLSVLVSGGMLHGNACLPL